MSNKDMTADEKPAALMGYINEGRTVYFSTCTRTTKVDAKVVASFAKVGAVVLKAKNGSLWLASGKKFVCVDLCRITVAA